MPNRLAPPGVLEDEKEDLREGTRQQYESEWIFIPTGGDKQFDHELDEIPWNCTVLYSDDATGSVTKIATTELSDSSAMKVTRVEVTYDPANLADNAERTDSITVTGAELGDHVSVAAPYDLQDLDYTAYVQAADKVEIRWHNNGTGGAVDLASGTWNFLLTKHTTPDAQIAYENLDSTKGSGSRSLTVTNKLGADAYFKVRTM